MAAQLLRTGLRHVCSGARLSNSSHNLLSIRPAVITKVPCASIVVWEPDKKAGYRKNKIKRTTRTILKDGIRGLPEEVDKYKEEVKKKLRFDSLYFVDHGDYEVVWRFDNEDSVANWILTSDRDNEEGKSQAEFILGQNQKGIFRGYVNKDVPKNGKTKDAGYCNIRSPDLTRSFQREATYDWTDYTHLMVKCRGDGRPYHLIIGMQRYWDVQWHDTFEFPLFTRGGPYWQIARIPFSKFFLVSHGRIQDKQDPIDLENVLSLGITMADTCSGPFQLEIEFIGVVFDKNHTQKTAYELYDCNPEHIY